MEKTKRTTSNDKEIGDPLMRFGVDSKILIGKEKQLFNSIIGDAL